MKAREAAYLALLGAVREEKFVTQSLAEWQQVEKPTLQDFALAYEIASGTARMALALDYIAENLSTKKKLSLKLKERVLMRSAIYQFRFMSRIPLYAIVDETIEIAKKYCHATFVSYLNALLRKLNEGIPELPSGNSPEAFSIRYSYPIYFVKALVDEYGVEAAEHILKAGNMPPKTMVRVRPGVDINSQALKILNPVKEAGLSIAILDKASNLSAIAAMPEIYIQNATPVSLVGSLAERTPVPKMILDLCASPGGKLLAAHDLYPEAALFANDVTQGKMILLSQNLSKYGVRADLNCGPGEEYPEGKLFDVVILDVPCSNSGVLNKRAEARWRLTQEDVAGQMDKQRRLLQHAARLLAPGGVIWYLTCSILKSENEDMVAEACKKWGLEMVFGKKILPNEDGWDGGFGSILKK